MSDRQYLNTQFILYLTIFWLFISFLTKFYNVYRYTHLLKLIRLILFQFFIFLLAFFAYFTIFKEGEVFGRQSFFVLSLIVIITFFKFFFFFLLKNYRLNGKNYRNVIVFGESKSAQNVALLFDNKKDLGYRFCGFFSNKRISSTKYLGLIKEGLDYSIENNIDEIYCEVSSISRDKLKEIRSFCNKNKIEFSLIPETKAIYSKDFILEHFGTIPILKPKPLPFERIETHIVKRLFDILFSSLICLFLLSWFLPFIWIFIRIDSKGPLIFKQKRDGLNGKEFYCYKLRSMRVNLDADKISASKNDKRITKVGAFLRKTSLDELPQFFNVLIGNMSIIGPRPHVNFQTQKYVKEVSNYLVRHSVKPGISGLAQVSGYRGEVIKKSDIEHRVRLDIFYIENWSFFLDIKIIMQTIFNVFVKEEKAY